MVTLSTKAFWPVRINPSAADKTFVFHLNNKFKKKKIIIKKYEKKKKKQLEGKDFLLIFKE